MPSIGCCGTPFTNRGSGRPVHEVNRLLKQFKEMRKMMKQMGQLAPRLAAGGKMGSLLQ